MRRSLPLERLLVPMIQAGLPPRVHENGVAYDSFRPGLYHVCPGPVLGGACVGGELTAGAFLTLD